MKPAEELPPLLWPFTARELYGFVPGGAQFAFAEPRPPAAELILCDIHDCKAELGLALKAVRNARSRPDVRAAAAELVTRRRRELVRLHLKLRPLSVGYRASPSSPIRPWA